MAGFAKEEKEKASIPKIIFSILAVAGLVTVALVAPNVVQLIDAFGNKRTFPRRHFRQAVRRLERQGYIRNLSDRTKWKFALTPKGKKILAKRNIENLRITRPFRWDGKWRVVVFDIPEKYKEARNALRWKLKELGFRYINLSVWVHPYDCMDVINALLAYNGVGEYTRVMLVERFDGMDDMQKEFGLL